MVLNYKRIGQRIRIMRKARKLTQAELAERTNLSVPYISHIENGIKQARLLAVRFPICITSVYPYDFRDKNARRM